jgi:formiminoglutamase
MSPPSSSVVEWFTRLEPCRTEDVFARPDDPRLGEIIERWHGEESALRPGRSAILGFPQDEGVRRNHGRDGAAEAPRQIRHWLYRLTPWDASCGVDLSRDPPLDLGNLRIEGHLEASQQNLGVVVAALLKRKMVPIVLGGGHETAFGHYLGYAAGGSRVGIINLDAHLDVRSYEPGRGHSGSPFRQAFEHAETCGQHLQYVCLGAQPWAVSREHVEYVQQRGGVIHWTDEVEGYLDPPFTQDVKRLAKGDNPVYVTVDADVVRAADVPGVSAPNAAGLSGASVLACVRRAGMLSAVTSIDFVEINPRFDRDGQSSRWAALAAWNFLVGLQARKSP